MNITTHHELHLTPLRLNDHYVIWYKNVASCLVTVVVPFVLLVFWNWNTWKVIQRRQRNRHRPTLHLKAAVAKEEEAKKAKILFVIVILFLACNTLRLVLNVQEMATMHVYRAAFDLGCNPVPFWVMVTNTVSKFLLTLNAALGVPVYCVMSRDFRRQFLRLCCGRGCAAQQQRARKSLRCRRMLSGTLGCAGAGEEEQESERARRACATLARRSLVEDLVLGVQVLGASGTTSALSAAPVDQSAVTFSMRVTPCPIRTPPKDPPSLKSDLDLEAIDTSSTDEWDEQMGEEERHSVAAWDTLNRAKLTDNKLADVAMSEADNDARRDVIRVIVH